ncbi:MAG TPA: DUF2206 domain-containing protein [Candidatus Saccharimonadales bacterium]|nr:DUF2206 domain-containing protein [Candidatus Saccharimonadales bacterium]
MKKLRLSARRTVWLLLCALAAANVLALLTQATGFWLFAGGLFACLVFLPGVATLRCLRLEPSAMYVSVLYCFGLSILALMLSSLFANQVLPLLGMQEPLRWQGVLLSWDILTGAVILLGAYTNKRDFVLRHLRVTAMAGMVWLLMGLSSLLPMLAIMGALRLNNGGDALFAMVAIAYAAGLIIAACVLHRRIPDGASALLIFITGLSLLFMVSLRGWDIVGHDIQREFRVYSLTLLNSRWDIGSYRDPYNACLSITLLPAAFSSLLGISGIVVFKVILQIIFAVCPAVVFALLRRYAYKLASLIGSLLFICYPTFITDSAMLTRQGVAYLFFALAILVLAGRSHQKRCKLLFMVCALGAILSHYSTAYMFVGLFGLTVVFKVCVRWGQGHPPWRRGHTSTVVSPLFAVLLLLLTFGWYARITETSGGVMRTMADSVASIPRFFSDDNKSSDTSVALVFAAQKTPLDLYEDYLTHSFAAGSAAAAYLPGLTSDALPLTQLGKKVHSWGIDPAIVSALRQNFAKLLQVMAVGGVVYVTAVCWWKRRYLLGADFIYLNFAGLVLLALMVLLPVLSINYGILRAFQQALIFLVLPITLLLVAAGRKMTERLRTVAATTGITALFLLFTGFIAQLLGGSSPSLSLNNQGLYYGLYYTSEADGRAFAWLKAHQPARSDVRAANFNRAFMHDPKYPFSRPGILPTQLGERSVVYLDSAQVTQERLFVYFDSSPLIMTFPADYYRQTKSRVYSTSSTEIYQ